MNKTVIVTELTDKYFQDAASLWELTAIGNPARGDDFDAVQKTLVNGARLILLYHDEQAIGTVWLTHDHRRLYIHHMAVHPEHQGNGYGKILMQEAQNIAKELNLQAKLEVHEANKNAYKLYKEFGFTTLDGYHTLIKRNI